MESKYFFSLAVCLLAVSPPAAAQPVPQIAEPDGFAGSAGTTGGGNADPIHVRSAEEFKSAASGDAPKVIVVHGDLGIGAYSVGSNTTIVGADENAGLHGGRINVDGTNYIFQNLTMYDGVDVMEVSGGSNVFVTKCTFHDAGDELFSIVRGADNVTASWCKFYFDNSHDHALVHLIGNSNGATGDRGKLHVTLHHNWYTKGAVGRMPRVRFGEVHVFNNYWDAGGNKYCIGVGKECHIRVEGGHFEGVKDPWADYGGSGDGELGWKDLIFESATEPDFMPNTYSTIFTPPYSYCADSARSVKAMVMAGAGNLAPTTAVPGGECSTTAVGGRGRVLAYPVVGDYLTYEWSPRLRIMVYASSGGRGPESYNRVDGKALRPLLLKAGNSLR